MTDIVYDGTTLNRVPSLTEITIESFCTAFRSVNDNDYAFVNARNSLEKCYFKDDSQLSTISAYSFYLCSKLSFIDLSKCKLLTEIGNYAFSGCSALQSIDFPESLQYIQDFSFSQSGLVNVLITKNILRIGVRAFQECKSLLTFEYAEDALITSISHHILVSCTKITTLHIPRYLTGFSGNTFEGCYALKSFTLDERNEHFQLYDRAIYNKDLTELHAVPPAITGNYTIANNVTILKTTAFICSQLSYVQFPEKLQTIENYCFYIAKIKEINLPASIRTIDSCAFRTCTELTTVIFPEGLKSLADEVFRGCYRLTTVVFPNTLKSLGGGVFTDCPDTIDISFSNSSNLKFDKDNYWITDKQNEFLSQCLSDNDNYTIPNTFKTIGISAFYKKSKLNKIFFDDNSQLESIGSQAFFMCTNLEIFQFPKLLQTIGPSAFANCTHLSNANFSQLTNLQTIDVSAFENCTSLTSIIFSSKLSLAEKAFYNCDGIVDLLLGDNLCKIGRQCFQYCISIDSVFIPQSCKTIEEYAFDGCISITNCTFSPDSIENLTSFIFNDCCKLSTIKFPNGLKSLGSHSLSNTSISNFTFPSSVQTIGYASMQNCRNLKIFTIPEDSELTLIEDDAFAGCSQFSKIDLPLDNSNFELWNEALFNKNKTEFIILPPASGVVYFSFPETLNKVRSSSFQNVNSLEVVFIPSSVTSIGSNVFRYCNNLRYINIPSSVSSIGDNTFEGCVSLQCGISIQNQTTEFRNMLINKAKLPARCLTECHLKYTCNSNIIRFSSHFVFISLIYTF